MLALSPMEPAGPGRRHRNAPSEISMQVFTFQILAQDLADEGAPGTVLLLVAVVVPAASLRHRRSGPIA